MRNAERAKYEIHNAVNDAFKVADSWQKFKSELEKRGVHLELVYKDKERTKVQGIRFVRTDIVSRVRRLAETIALAN